MALISELAIIPPRKPDSHKGSYGRGLVLGGAEGMAGAAAMCAESALRSGAGLITIGAPQSIVPVLAAKTTCPTTHAFAETSARSFATEAVTEAAELAAGYTAVALGPGMGTHRETKLFALTMITQLQVPTVIDADGLNNLSTEVDVLERRSTDDDARPVPFILTPHPGEMSRLTGKSIADIQQDRRGTAEEFARQFGVVVVLKGYQTVVTDGSQTYINQTGNAGMATGGAGDVLTGVILGLLCQKLEPFAAAQVAVYVHGLAGDIAAEAKGQISMIATDIQESLPQAFRQYMTAP